MTWEIERRLRCSTCNTYHDEWSPKDGGDIHAYYPHTHVCLGCKAVEDAYSAVRTSMKESGSDTAMHGLQVRLEPNREASKPPLPLSGRKVVTR